MVQTRSQARKAYLDSESSASSPTGTPVPPKREHESERAGELKSSHNRRFPTIKLNIPGCSPASSSASIGAAPENAKQEPEEQLGRGCRVRRPVVSLDQEYAARLMNQKWKSNGDDSSDDEFRIHERYPQREAATKALATLKKALDSDSDDGDGASSDSMDAHHAHHHRVLRQEARRGRRHTYREQHRPPTPPSPLSSQQPKWGGASLRKKQSSSTNARRGRRDGDGDSVASSITDASMRDESVEQLAAKDAMDRSTSLSSEGDSEDEGLMDAQERAHAIRQAKSSAQNNISINYYIADAVGEDNEKKLRKRQLDRRYRHLFHAEEVARSGGGGEGGGASGVDTAAGALGDISPLLIDDSISFDSVGGLPQHIVTLREMVLLPLLYPDLFTQLDLKAPRGVLFVGPPGTGKTLLARALANEGSRLFARAHEEEQQQLGRHSGGSNRSASRRMAPPSAPRKITFFMRKGADILSKWVGESERQLKLLFEEAKRQQPSIIFFDEIDGLAPTRHTKTEQTQAALVATLLALLDGLEDRGQVVVIGATNRPDTLDPALRRPGRFDRELVFPHPDAAARRHILSILLERKVSPETEGRESMLEELAQLTEGYSGADLSALCTEAGLHRLRVSLPQLYTCSSRLSIPTGLQRRLQVQREDFFAAAQLLQPSLQRIRRGSGGGEDGFLEPHMELLCRGAREATLRAVAASWPMVRRIREAAARDCRDLATAVAELCMVPVPLPARPCLLVVEPQVSSSAPAEDTLLHMFSLSLMRGLPSLQSIVVQLPEISFADMSTGLYEQVAEGAAVNDFLVPGATAGRSRCSTMAQLVSMVYRLAPCVVYLRGAEEWLEKISDSDEMEEGEDGEKGKSASTSANKTRAHYIAQFRYYMNQISAVEAIFLLPCARAETRRVLLGEVADVDEGAFSPRLELSPPGETPRDAFAEVPPPAVVSGLTRGALPPQYSVVSCRLGTIPAPKDLAQFIEYCFRVVSLAWDVQASTATSTMELGSSAEMRRDDSARPSPADTMPSSQQRAMRRADRQRRLELWRKVEYRRLQLRHIMVKWITQLINSARYKLLLDAGLDLDPKDPISKQWRRHTAGHYIGLADILEKVENEEYVCLSQYHDDIDQLVRNVRSFFRSRSPTDMRYRLKALDLKETCVLNLYKVNRSAVRFCEEHRDVVEPSEDEDDLASARDARSPAALAELSRKAVTFSQRPPSAVHKKKRKRNPWAACEGRRGRPKRPRTQPEDPENDKEHAEEEEEGDEEGGGHGEEEEEDDDEDATPDASGSLDGSLLREATEWLRRFTYFDLHEVFKRLMIALDEELRHRRAAFVEECEYHRKKAAAAGTAAFTADSSPTQAATVVSSTSPPLPPVRTATNMSLTYISSSSLVAPPSPSPTQGEGEGMEAPTPLRPSGAALAIGDGSPLPRRDSAGSHESGIAGTVTYREPPREVFLRLLKGVMESMRSSKASAS